MLAVATKTLQLDPAAVASLSRDEAEGAGLQFVGLLLFKNKLKPDSAAAVAALRFGAVRPVMITGDTHNTGYYIAEECGMIPAEA